MSKPLSVLVVLAMAGSLAVPAATAFHRDDLPVIASDTSNGSAAWGVKVNLAAQGDIAVDLYGFGPMTSKQVMSAGASVTDANGNPSFTFVFSAVSSPDRKIGVPIETGTLPPGMVLHYGAEGKVQTASVGASAGASSDAACTFFCLGLASTNQDPGAYHYVLWIAGVSSANMEVRANSATASFNRGIAQAAGDADITNGDQNIQDQTNGVGVKVMQNAFVPFSAPGHVYGMWQDLNLKLVCLGLCLAPVQTVNYALTFACGPTGVAAGTAVLSISGALSAKCQQTYFVLNGPSGDYKFNVDLKVDAYSAQFNPFLFVAGALLLEDFSILSVGSATVPA